MRYDRDGWAVIAEPPEQQAVGSSGRAAYQAPRPRRLTPEEEVAVRALAESRSLRSLAADFGVSHETVRRVVRDAAAGTA